MGNATSKWIIIVALMGTANIEEVKAQGAVSLQVFYNELQPYGTWIHHPAYGNVWIPRVGDDFVPYGTNGYWINTDYGNTWVSDYSWGWAPFHYGRWFYDDFYGWVWVPDTIWGPAWVAWRSGGGYYGWAPLMPGFGVSASYNYYTRIPHYYWNFVPCRYFTYRQVYRHCVSRTTVVNVIHHTTIVTHNNTDNRKQSYFTGPSRSDIERTTNQRVQMHKINDRIRPGRTEVEGGTVSFYKPDFNRSSDAKSRTLPERFTRNENSVDRTEYSREFPADIKSKGLPNNGRSSQPEDRSVDRSGFPKDIKTFERSQQRSLEKQDQSFQNFKNERENTKRDQPEFNQRSPKTVERQSDNRPEQNFQRQREQFSRPAPSVPDNNTQRTPDRQPQRMQPVERQSSGQVNRSYSPPERSTVTPSRSSPSQPQREQIRSNSDNQTNRPTRTVDEKKPSPSRGR